MGSISTFADHMNNFFFYITHPLDLLLLIWQGISYASFYICIAACFIGIILHMAEVDKGKKIAIGSIFIYLVICMINAGGAL